MCFSIACLWLSAIAPLERGVLRDPHRFIDSDLYKVMEGAAYLLQLRRDPELEKTLDDLADLIEGAQHKDGYP